MGHSGLYNKNQIREKLFPVLIFLQMIKKTAEEENMSTR